MFCITFHTAKHNSTLLLVILRLFIKNGLHGWRAGCISTVNFKLLQEVECHSITGTALTSETIFGNRKPFKNHEKMLSIWPYRSQDN